MPRVVGLNIWTSKMNNNTTLTSSIDGFFNALRSGVFSTEDTTEVDQDVAINDILTSLRDIKKRNARVFLIGNGGSAAIVSHILTDLRNVGGICGITLHEPAPLTCFTNDYGYEEAYSRQLDSFAGDGDLLIAISSSGRSQNILNAVEVARKRNMKVMTLSGFDASNPLRKMGNWNYWLDSHMYGQVEVGHLFLLHHVMDNLGK